MVRSFMDFQPSTFWVLINFGVMQFKTPLSHFERVYWLLRSDESRNKTLKLLSLRLSTGSPQMARILRTSVVMAANAQAGSVDHNSCRVIR
jgi:hypothetical protein